MPKPLRVILEWVDSPEIMREQIKAAEWFMEYEVRNHLCGFRIDGRFYSVADNKGSIRVRRGVNAQKR